MSGVYDEDNGDDLDIVFGTLKPEGDLVELCLKKRNGRIERMIMSQNMAESMANIILGAKEARRRLG